MHSTTRAFPSKTSQVGQLKYADVLRTAKTFSNASRVDPLVRYIRDNRDLTRSEKFLEQLQIAVHLMHCIHSRVALTVNSGIASIICSTQLHGRQDNDPFVTLTKRLTKSLRAYKEKKVLTSEGKKRRKEFDLKMSEAVSNLFGNYLREMWYIESLATHPSSQHQGYGTALLRYITLMADVANRTLWLLSSNIVNNPFYNKHGFFTVDEIVLGEGNPSWDYSPIVVSIMIREPKA